MIIIDHGHKDRCEFQHIKVGEPFRSDGITNRLFIKTGNAISVMSGGTLNSVRLADGSMFSFESTSPVYTVKAHIEVD